MKISSLFVSVIAVAALSLSACQEKPEEPEWVKDPVLKPACDTVFVPAAGGDDYLITYLLENPVTGGVINAKCECEGGWISDIDYNVLGKVSFKVAVNEEREKREGSITVEYTVPEASPLSFTVVVIQEGAAADVVFDAAFFEGDYYGTAMSVAHNYFVTISDLGMDDAGYLRNGATYYQFDIYGEAPADPSAPMIPDGTYTLSESGMFDSGTFSIDVSCVLSISESGDYIGPYMFTEGTFTIKKEGDIYNMHAEVVTDDGRFHVIEYSGPISLRNLGPKDIWSTLAGDYEADLSGDYNAVANYYGDFYGAGSCNWMVRIEPVSGTGDAIQLELNTSSFDFYDGIPSGTYSGSDTYEALTFVPGYEDNLNLYATWWFWYDNNMLGENYAPLTAGEITVTNHGDGTYTFDFFCFDDSPDYNLFTATWTGEMSLEGYYEGSAMMKGVDMKSVCPQGHPKMTIIQ